MNTVTTQEHMNGHYYGPNNAQNRGPHFNGPNNTHYDRLVTKTVDSDNNGTVTKKRPKNNPSAP